ncbi:hypothetical protein BUALT_Bualt01G0190800 [Buddleja alternifolia]|uniref:MIF4G domain-containing protein n=1 Tax=Buddleja alternifolia TaxID=168488 RepID=A0AAV6YE82_9LAMI|nr:hypothetical protein BUALT_Bualt01G0190800 [Buddleja alternifolia]
MYEEVQLPDCVTDNSYYICVQSPNKITVNVVGLRPGQGGNHGVLRNPHAQTPVQYARGILSGQRNNSDSVGWQRGTGFQKRLQARRRLGNIRLIGELYKKRMLTERIMHECINKLLGQHQNPDEENIEALCTLMSTIGEMIDHPKAKNHMDA